MREFHKYLSGISSFGWNWKKKNSTHVMWIPTWIFACISPI